MEGGATHLMRLEEKKENGRGSGASDAPGKEEMEWKGARRI
jgi:hypothetical protein